MGVLADGGPAGRSEFRKDLSWGLESGTLPGLTSGQPPHMDGPGPPLLSFHQASRAISWVSVTPHSRPSPGLPAGCLGSLPPLLLPGEGASCSVLILFSHPCSRCVRKSTKVASFSLHAQPRAGPVPFVLRCWDKVAGPLGPSVALSAWNVLQLRSPHTHATPWPTRSLHSGIS